MIFIDPLNKLMPSFYDLSLYWRLKIFNEDGIVYIYKFVLQRSRKFDEYRSRLIFDERVIITILFYKVGSLYKKYNGSTE